MKSTILMTVSALAFATPVWADDSFPNFSAEFALEVQTDYTFSSTDPTAEFINTYATIEAGLALAFTPSTSLNSTILFEQVIDPVDDGFFEDHGLYVEELFLLHEVESFGIKLGKFNAEFGNEIPGLYGDTFTEDYEVNEKLGAAVAVPFDLLGGEHAFNLAAFAEDITILSDSAIQDRGRINRNTGGVSNTQSPESFALWLDGEFGDTGYGGGFQFQSRGMGDTDDQLGFVFGLTQSVENVGLIAEAGYFPTFGGGPESAFYGTVGAEVPVGPVDLTALYSVRNIDMAATDHIGTLSAAFGITDELSVEAGYLFARDGGETSHTIGAVIVFEFGVSTD